MTPEDKALLLETLRWARDNGWTKTQSGWISPDGQYSVAYYADHHVLTEIAFSRKIYGKFWQSPTVLYVDSVRQAIDVLVAYRVLPAYLHGAVRALIQMIDGEEPGDDFMKLAEAVGVAPKSDPYM